MDQNNQCPESGKIYILIIFCLVFTSLLTTINVVSKNTDESLFGTGIAINIIQSIFTLYLIGIDLFGKCQNQLLCEKNCRWYNFQKYQYIKYFIILLSCAYLLAFGIINIYENEQTSDDLMIVSIASFISGIIGMLYIFSDIVCLFGCGF